MAGAMVWIFVCRRFHLYASRSGALPLKEGCQDIRMWLTVERFGWEYSLFFFKAVKFLDGGVWGDRGKRGC